MEVLATCFQGATHKPMQPGQIRYGQWKSGESIVVTPLELDRFEIHCHGGEAAIHCILQDLRALGVEIVPADQFHPVPKSLLIREAECVLAQCTTTRTAAIAMHQVRGALEEWAHANNLPRHSSGLSSHTGLSSHNPLEAKRDPSTKELIQRSRFTARMTTPFQVVLYGAPNVGKSSLVNAMVGYRRSITTEIAGTTRDVLHAETVIDGIPVRLSDTAGVRRATDAIEQAGVCRANQAVDQADVILRVRDQQHEFIEVSKRDHQQVIDVFNKSDLRGGESSDSAERAVIPVSATTGDGIDRLLQAIVEVIVPDGCDEGGPAILNERQLQWIRSWKDNHS